MATEEELRHIRRLEERLAACQREYERRGRIIDREAERNIRLTQERDEARDLVVRVGRISGWRGLGGSVEVEIEGQLWDDLRAAARRYRQESERA